MPAKKVPKWPVMMFCWYSQLLLRALKIALPHSNKGQEKDKTHGPYTFILQSVSGTLVGCGRSICRHNSLAPSHSGHHSLLWDEPFLNKDLSANVVMLVTLACTAQPSWSHKCSRVEVWTDTKWCHSNATECWNTSLELPYCKGPILKEQTWHLSTSVAASKFTNPIICRTHAPVLGTHLWLSHTCDCHTHVKRHSYFEARVTTQLLDQSVNAEMAQWDELLSEDKNRPSGHSALRPPTSAVVDVIV